MTSDMPTPRAKEWPAMHEMLIGGFFSFLPFLAIVAPRFLTLAPMLAALGMFFSYRFVCGAWPRISAQAFGWACGLAALMALSILWAYNVEGTQERVVKVFPLLIGGTLLFSTTKTIHGNVFRKYFPVGMIAAGIVLCIELYAGPHLTLLLRPGLGEMIKENNTAGLNRGIVFFILCFFPALSCCRENYKSWRAMLLALVTGAVLFKTDSQSAQAAFVIGIIFYFAFPVRLKAAWFGLAGVLTAFFLAMPWAVQLAFDDFALSANEGHGWFHDGYAAMRLEIWDFVARRIMESPVYGFGIDATKFMTFDTQTLYFEANHVLHPHSFILQLWLELGVLGPLFAAAFFCALLKGIYDSPSDRRRPLLALLCATISAASTSYGLWQSWWVGSFCLLLCFGPLAADRRQQ